MARTPSNMLPLGTTAPNFKLKDVSSGEWVSEQLKDEKGLLLIFMCNHCPFVIHVIEELVRVEKDFEDAIKIVAISSNDVDNYPQDSPEKMQAFKQHYNFHFPYLYDESQEVAKSFDAACTPDFFLFNSKLKLVYRGQLDDSRPGNDEPVNGKDLRKALKNLIQNKPIAEIQKPSVGCNIKWK